MSLPRRTFPKTFPTFTFTWVTRDISVRPFCQELHSPVSHSTCPFVHRSSSLPLPGCRPPPPFRMLQCIPDYERFCSLFLLPLQAPFRSTNDSHPVFFYRRSDSIHSFPFSRFFWFFFLGPSSVSPSRAKLAERTTTAGSHRGMSVSCPPSLHASLVGKVKRLFLPDDDRHIAQWSFFSFSFLV